MTSLRLRDLAMDLAAAHLGRQAAASPSSTPDDSLARALQGKGVTIQVIGDARAPRSYGNAIHEAAYLARRI